MKMEIRNGSIIIDGYVNAVERFSKPLYDIRGKFIERIMPTVFSRAIERNNEIKVLLNHEYDRELANTNNGTAELYEDNIGLRAIVKINDPEVIEKAKENKLRGWSFGFHCNKEERRIGQDGMEERDVRDIDLFEVSIIDDRKMPAYYGTSIEMRDENETLVEFRGNDFDCEVVIREEETIPEETTANDVPEQLPEKEIEKIDYSEYEERIKKLKEEC